jgi:enamine deaminase RidA (YjgF/YER057c/UK114 family)
VRDVVNTTKYRIPGRTFSQIVRVQPNSTLLFVSGITARGEDGKLRAPGDIEGQTRQILQNISNMLADAGADLSDVIRITTYLTDIRHIERVSRVRREAFGEPPPASTTVGVTGLADPAMLIEIDAVAVLSLR